MFSGLFKRGKSHFDLLMAVYSCIFLDWNFQLSLQKICILIVKASCEKLLRLKISKKITDLLHNLKIYSYKVYKKFKRVKSERGFSEENLYCKNRGSAVTVLFPGCICALP